MRKRATTPRWAIWSWVLVTIGVTLLISFYPTYARGDEERTVSTPASQVLYSPLQVQPVNVNITQINPSKFPNIELVLVTGRDGNTISGLGASNFLATEQSNHESQPTTETISVAPITAAGDIAVALTIDRIRSMDGSEIATPAISIPGLDGIWHGIAAWITVDVHVLDLHTGEFNAYQVAVNVSGFEIIGIRFGCSPQEIARAVNKQIAGRIGVLCGRR